MSLAPQFTKTGHIARVSVAAANTGSGGTGTINAFLLEDNTTQFTGSLNGSRLEKITFVNAQTLAAASSANVIRVFISDSLGSNYRLYKEVALLTATRTTSAVGASGEIYLGGVDIGPGVKVGVVQSVYAGVQDVIHYTLEYADY